MTVIRKLLTIVFYRPEKEWFVSERTDAVALQGGICRAQARRLKIRVNGEKGKYFAHTLNNTVVAPPRMLIAFLENNLQADGSVKIPEVLQPYMGGMTEIREKK